MVREREGVVVEGKMEDVRVERRVKELWRKIERFFLSVVQKQSVDRFVKIFAPSGEDGRVFSGIQLCWAKHQSPQLPFTNSIKVWPNLQKTCEFEREGGGEKERGKCGREKGNG